MTGIDTPRISATASLIIINVVVYFAGLMAQQEALFCIPIEGGFERNSIFQIFGAYSWFTCMMEGQFWRVISYQFVHAGFQHLLFNMWALYFFGKAVEQVFGPQKFLAFYFICGIAGALFASLLGGLNILSYGDGSLNEYNFIQSIVAQSGYVGQVEIWQLIPMVGASASVYGILVASAFLFPHARVQLLFPPIALKLRTLAIAVIVIANYTIITNGNNAGGEAGHLGGVIMATLLMIFLKNHFYRTRNW